MLHSFIKPGLFEPEAVAAMSEAFEAACKQLDDAGQPELVLEVIAGRLSRRQELVSMTRFACGRPALGMLGE